MERVYFTHIVDSSGSWKDGKGKHRYSIVNSQMPGAMPGWGLWKGKHGMPVHPQGPWIMSHSEEDYAIDKGLTPVAGFSGTFL